MKPHHLIIVGLLCFLGLYLIGGAITTLSFKASVVLVLGLIFAMLTLINLEFGLFLLIFVIPFTQQIRLGRVARLPVDVGTDDLLIIFILLSWLAILARSKEPFFLKTSLNVPLASFFTVGVASLVIGANKFGGGAILVGLLHLLKFFEYVAIYFIVVSAVKSIEQIKKYIYMFIGIACFVALIQFGAMLKWGIINLSTPPPEATQIRLYLHTMQSFSSNAVLGAYHCFFLSILLAVILDMPPSRSKMVLGISAVILSFALFNAFSRSAYVGILISFLVFAKLKERRFLLIILALAVFSPIYMQTAVLERITFTLQSVKPLTFDPSAAIRLVIWKQAIPIILDNIFIGNGYWMTRYALQTEAHNQYLAILIETGIIGFSIFCWLIVRMLKNAMNLIQKSTTGFLKALGTGYLAGMAGILTTCFFTETLEAFQMIGPMWFVTGLITCANRLASEPEEGIQS